MEKLIGYAAIAIVLIQSLEHFDELPAGLRFDRY
jgi:hypothetical protein